MLQVSVMVASAQAVAAPECVSGSTCSSISITEEGPGQFVISRGMDGYSNYEQAVIQFEGPAVIQFTDFDTEYGYDFLTVDGTRLSGSSGWSPPPDMQLSNGQKEITWSSDYSVVRNGWALVFHSTESSYFVSYFNTTSTTYTSSTATTKTFTSTTATVTTLTATTFTATTTMTLRSFNFDVTSDGCRVDVENECIQNPDFPLMSNSFKIFCTGETNLALYATVFNTDGNAHLALLDPMLGDDSRLSFAAFPGKPKGLG